MVANLEPCPASPFCSMERVFTALGGCDLDLLKVIKLMITHLTDHLWGRFVKAKLIIYTLRADSSLPFHKFGCYAT
jgi:hypothetical protein